MVLGYADGVLTSSTFYNPYGMCIDASGIMYVVDSNNYVVREIALSNVYTLAGSSSYGSTDGTQTTAKFSAVSSIALISTGIWIVTDAIHLRLISVSKLKVYTECSR